MDNSNKENLEKLQTFTDIIGKHWSARGLDSNKLKENNAAILVLDEFFQKIVHNNSHFNLDILKGSLKGPSDRSSYSFLHQLTMNPLMSIGKYKQLMAQEIHQYFLESSQQTEGFTTPNCLSHPMHITNLRNFIAFKVITSSFVLRDLVAGWHPKYFDELKINPKHLVECAVNDPQDFKNYLKAVDSQFEQMLIHLRSTLDRSHIYIIKRNSSFTSDCPAYYLDLPKLNVPLDKIKRHIPFEQSHQDFLRNIIYCPISESHIAVCVPYSITFKPTFQGEYKHLIEGFIHSNLPEYIGLTNSKVLIIPLLQLQSFLQETMNIIMTEPFDLMLMSRALSMLPRNNVDAIIEVLQGLGHLN